MWSCLELATIQLCQNSVIPLKVEMSCCISCCFRTIQPMEYMGSSYFSLKNQVIKAERRILKVSLYMKIDLPNHKTPLKFWLFQKVVQQILAIFLHDMIRMVFFFCTKKVLLKYHPPSLVMFSWWPPVGCALFFNVGISIIYSCLNFLKSCWNEITISQLCYLRCSVHYWLFVFQELGFCVHVKHPHKVHKKLSCQQWYQLLLTTEIEVLFYLSILFYLGFFCLLY